MGDAKSVILVVEDEALVRMGVAFSLEDAGFEVIEASDYNQAIAALVANQSIAAMFTDVDMPPGSNGLDLATTVRRRWPPVRIIVTSGKRQMGNENLPVSARFMAKPYDSEKVITSLRDMLGAA